tara:strand:- start:15684 stop:17024 length:1341 start_codon:yes stop_codon:yes gene_type:complete
MSTRSPSPRIAVFGHYGNQNLGDEAIIEAVLKNLRHHLPNAELSCFSINPLDSASRHGVDSFPIRYRADYFNPPRTQTPAQEDTPAPAAVNEVATPLAKSWKTRLKSFPLLGSLLRKGQNVVEFRHTLKQEVVFLRAASMRLETVDLLLITGSNQFLDNFGGPWGFPYTLLKWTWLAKRSGTKVAFLSIGAGPLTHPLSYWMLGRALKRADYLSLRDEGSQALIREKVGIEGAVFPDLAHSLYESGARPSRAERSDRLRVAVNPMPVFDRRYWHHPDDTLYRDYVQKLARLCEHIVQEGAHLTLFSTQLKDEDVIDDVIEAMGVAAPPSIARSRTVAELMETLSQSDCVVATRFHATVLPLQLGIPVLGICYYRKAAELLVDVGLGDYFVNIDDFDDETLRQKYKALTTRISSGSLTLSEEHSRYIQALDEQYRNIAALAVKGDQQ